MRKHQFFLTVCLFSFFSTQAETLIATYTSTFFNKDFQIEASEVKDDKFSVFIQIANKEQDTKTQIRIEKAKMEAFILSLQKLKSTYEAWLKNSSSGDSMIDPGVEFPKVTFRWWLSEWVYSFNNKLEPKFLLLNDGRRVVSFANKVKTANNYQSDVAVYWIFASVQDFDQILSILAPSNLIPKLSVK